MERDGNKLGFYVRQNFVNNERICLYPKSFRYREHSGSVSIFVLLLGLRGHSPPKSGLGVAAGKTETERVKSDESGTISASGKYIKGKLFNRKNVSCDRKCVRARARLHVYSACIRVYIYTRILKSAWWSLFSRISYFIHSPPHRAQLFLPSIVFSNSQRSMRVNPFRERTMQDIHRALMFSHRVRTSPSLSFLSLSHPPPPFFPSLYRYTELIDDTQSDISWQNFFYPFNQLVQLSAFMNCEREGDR